jgi:hypothetical protein
VNLPESDWPIGESLSGQDSGSDIAEMPAG